VSSDPAADRLAPHESVAGFLAAIAIFASVIGIIWHPLRLIPIAVVLSFIASGMGGRYQRLSFLALLIGTASFFLGLTVAIIWKHPLW
jgi:hypothetical protein